MSMGTREDGQQPPIWVDASEVARGEGHVFYRRLNELLRRHGFDAFAEKRVSESGVFADGVGRPSIPPGV
jgi:transposase